jgi:hypothetical protein
MQLMQVNCWILQVDFIDPMAFSMSELPQLTGDSDESEVMLSDDDSSPKGVTFLTPRCDFMLTPCILLVNIPSSSRIPSNPMAPLSVPVAPPSYPVSSDPTPLRTCSMYGIDPEGCMADTLQSVQAAPPIENPPVKPRTAKRTHVPAGNKAPAMNFSDCKRQGEL